jgi:nucleotide-binding universal stress UspA family protein
MDEATCAGILIGYDGSQHSARALDWAVLEARRHDAPLVVCMAVPQATPEARPYWIGWVPDEEVLAEAERVLYVAREQVAELAPDVPVTCETVQDVASRGLVARASRAEMIVVGSRGRGGVASMLLGSVSRYVAAHAPCPVVVVPAHDETVPAKPGNLVVVGYDGSTQAEAAMAVAVTESVLRGAELEVVHSWEDPYVAAGLALPSPVIMNQRERTARDLVLTAVERWADKYPELEITPSFTVAPAAHALVGRSRSADLVVVGSHGHGAFAGMLLGSVSNAVAHAAKCPVTVVRTRLAADEEPCPRREAARATLRG